MRSIKPGRGPSAQNFFASIIAILFGIFWTATAAAMTQGSGLLGFIFPLFGILFICIGVGNALYHYQNFRGKNRMSAYDITEEGEEPDPLTRGFSPGSQGWQTAQNSVPDSPCFCPYCGTSLQESFRYCPKCGRKLPGGGQF